MIATGKTAHGVPDTTRREVYGSDWCCLGRVGLRDYGDASSLLDPQCTEIVALWRSMYERRRRHVSSSVVVSNDCIELRQSVFGGRGGRCLVDRVRSHHSRVRDFVRARVGAALGRGVADGRWKEGKESACA